MDLIKWQLTFGSCNFGLEIILVISDQIALHSVQLPLIIHHVFVFISLQSPWSEYTMNTKVVQGTNPAANWTNSTVNLTATDEVPYSSSLLVVQVFLGGISVSAFLGNGLVCVVVMLNRDILRSAYNTFLFGLAITDMLTGNRCENSVFPCLMTENQIAPLPIQYSLSIGPSTVPHDTSRSFLKIFWLFYGKLALNLKLSFSLFQALSQCGRSKKRAGDKRDQLRAGSGSEPDPARRPPDFSIVHAEREPGIGYPFFSQFSFPSGLFNILQILVYAWSLNSQIKLCAFLPD